VNHNCAGLLEGQPALDEIIRFDRKRYGRIGRSLSVTREFVRFLGELRARRFDLVVDLQGLFRSGFLAMATGAKVRVGLGDARELAGLFHPYYKAHRVIQPDRELMLARLALCTAVGDVLRNGLVLLGVSAPEAMTREPEAA
jgi:ADP-heptose:LPS heptosyltransferase